MLEVEVLTVEEQGINLEVAEENLDLVVGEVHGEVAEEVDWNSDLLVMEVMVAHMEVEAVAVAVGLILECRLLETEEMVVLMEEVAEAEGVTHIKEQLELEELVVNMAEMEVMEE